MKSRNLLVVLALLLLGLGSGYWAMQKSLKRVAAAAEVEEPRPVTAPSEPVSEAPRLDDGPPSLPTPSPLALDPKPKLDALNEMARQRYRNTWVRIREERIFDADIPNNGVLPHGRAIPLHQINDFWYEVNAQGEVTTTLTIMQDAEGNIIQIGLCHAGTSWNSVTEERGRCDVTTPLRLDGGFQHQLQWLRSKGATVTYAGPETLNDTRTRYKVVVTQAWRTPWYGDAYDKGVIRAIEEAFFSEDTGALVEWKTTFVFEDGSRRLYRHILRELSVTASPPEEIRALLDEALR